MKNKTMKVIDLLNKIANGEEAPKKIKFNGIEWIKDYNNDYKSTHNGEYLFSDGIGVNQIIDGCIEITEEKPKKIDIIGEMKNQYSIANNYSKDNIQCIVNGFYRIINSLINKNNELTKAVNYLLEKDEKND